MYKRSKFIEEDQRGKELDVLPFFVLSFFFVLVDNESGELFESFELILSRTWQFKFLC